MVRMNETKDESNYFGVPCIPLLVFVFMCEHVSVSVYVWVCVYFSLCVGMCLFQSMCGYVSLCVSMCLFQSMCGYVWRWSKWLWGVAYGSRWYLAVWSRGVSCVTFYVKNTQHFLCPWSHSVSINLYAYLLCVKYTLLTYLCTVLFLPAQRLILCICVQHRVADITGWLSLVDHTDALSWNDSTNSFAVATNSGYFRPKLVTHCSRLGVRTLMDSGTLCQNYILAWLPPPP